MWTWAALALLAAVGSDPDAGTTSKKEAYLASKADTSEVAPAPETALEVVYARNLHTHEVMVLEGPRVEPTAVDAFLRCWFTHDSSDIPDELVGRVLEAAHHFGARQVQIISGFRHPKYNKMLRKKGREVAERSQHTLGNAIDFRLVGVPTEKLRAFVRGRHDGGVGYYPFSAFIHIDTGRKRNWKGR
jgi:uncharacterized protein YcbK (DUF882 family)